MSVNDKQNKAQPNTTQPGQGPEFNPWEFENPWAHQLCNCSEHCDETCYGIWCYPCFICHLSWRMKESCWITCCVPGYLAILRTKMRTAFRIKVKFELKIFFSRSNFHFFLFFDFLGFIFCRLLCC